MRLLIPRLALTCAALLPASARALAWETRVGSQLPKETGAVAQQVELADLDADGYVDLVITNCAGESSGGPDTAQRNQVLLNLGGVAFAELGGVFEEPDNAFAVEAADLDRDGDLDLVLGVNFQGESYALVNEGGAFTRAPLVAGDHSIGDLALGDLDGDGDLDILAADWGDHPTYGGPDDPGGPLRLWLGDGAGGFVDAAAQLPDMGPLAAWSFDVELVDLDNDFDLDVFVATRGPGHALVLRNDGAGGFALHPVPALQPPGDKQTNVAFAPVDLDLDGFLDLVTLRDGEPGCVLIDGEQFCGARNSALINTGTGQFLDNPGGFWPPALNPPRQDLDVAALDFDSDGRSDLLLTGPMIGDDNQNSRLLFGGPAGLSAPPPAYKFPVPNFPELGASLSAASGLQLADLDRDGREDIALVQRSDLNSSYALFARDDPEEGVPKDVAPPRIGPFEAVPEALVFGQELVLRARVHDAKSSAAWHDWQHDPALADANLAPGSVRSGDRRLPSLEFALGVSHPLELAALADDDPAKHIAPGVWVGEHLWRARFTVPYAGAAETTLAWRWCAIDAAGNRACTAAESAAVTIDPAACGDGEVQPWEECDDAQDPGTCAGCLACAGGCTSGADESQGTCPEGCPEDPTSGGDPPVCGDDLCAPGEACPADCAGEAAGASVDILPPDGCLCRGGGPGGGLALLGLLLLRRRRRG